MAMDDEVRAPRTSPLCVRLSAQDRQLVEMVAQYMNQTVSDYVRSMIVGASAQVVAQQGADKIVQELHERNERMTADQRRLFEETARKASTSAGLR
ncbi:MAG: hypothetical protein ACT4RN_22585 [Pseudonocardia sp.]